MEKYTRNLAEDIRDLQKTVGEIDARNRSYLEQVHGSLSSIQNGHKDILRSHEDFRTRQESQARGKNLSDTMKHEVNAIAIFLIVSGTSTCQTLTSAQLPI